MISTILYLLIYSFQLILYIRYTILSLYIFIFREENLQDYEGIGSEEGDFMTTYNYDYRHPFPYVKRYYLKPEVSMLNKLFVIKNRYKNELNL